MSENNFDFNKYQSPTLSSSSTPNAVPRKRNSFPIIASTIIALGLIATAIVTKDMWYPKENGTAPPESAPPTQNVKPPSGDALNTVQVYQKVAPSVVGVVTYAKNSKLEPAGFGSGVILNKEGHIITNAHVIDGAAGVKVVLSNHTEFEASIVGMDVKTDLAIIKVNPSGDFIPAEFGDSNALKPGEDVVAIGNPSGPQLAGSITKGIISGVNREIQSYGGITVKAIQVDAAINPGNSGGALVNMYGQVVGINSSKIASDNFEGIGFSIPMADAQPIINNLIQYGYVKDRVRLGVTVLAIDELLGKLNGLPVGLYIREIEPTSDLAQKGVQAGDVITEFDGKALNTSQALIDQLLTHKPGDKVKLKLFRKEVSGPGKTFDVEVTLEEDKSTLVIPK